MKGETSVSRWAEYSVGIGQVWGVLVGYEESWKFMEAKAWEDTNSFIKHGILLMITYFRPYLKQLERSALLIGSAV